MNENQKFLTEQIITYIGNKRSLLSFIENPLKRVKKELGKEKLDIADVFSGSGVVSRFFKRYSSNLYVNDLEDYCFTINSCYLTNEKSISKKELNKWYRYVIDNINNHGLVKGFISELYSPVDDNNIRKGERAFYTSRNAMYIDTCRKYIEDVPSPYKELLLGPLLYEASTKVNTSGVFKGFYKNSSTNIGQWGGNGENALNRIKANIELKKPVLSNFNTKVTLYKMDANKLHKVMPHVDLVYMDPPYNQHPYSSNYFMLNLINNYKKPEVISKVSGIPEKWNKSKYNKKVQALVSLEKLCRKIDASYILISYNSEGFITYKEMIKMLESIGKVKVYEKKYNTYRASRNLKDRKLHVKEFLFLVKKEDEQC